MPPPFPVTEKLAAFAAGLSIDDVPTPVRDTIRTSFTDQIGVIMAAASLGNDSLAMVDMARSIGGRGATLLGNREQATPIFAALANGALAHALDFEETHDATLVHPSASVVPAVLAVAESRGASGADVMVALCAGSEVVCRIGQSFVGNPQDDTSFFILPLVGAIGAAVGAGRILGLTAEQMEQAMSIAMGQVVNSAAVLTDPQSSVREVRDGYNAKAGVLAAELALRGVSGVRAALEGPHGYYDMFAKGRFDVTAFDGIGTRFDCLSLSFKPWPACRGAHSFIDMALDLRASHDLSLHEIDRIDIGVSPFFATLCEPRALRCAPPNDISARFSIPFSIAVALVENGVELGSFGAEARADAATLALANTVHHEVLDLPQDRSTEGRMAIRMKDGTVFEAHRAQPPGHPTRPLATEVLRNKFRACASLAPCPPAPSELDRILDRFASLETVGDIHRDLTALL